MCGCWFSNTLSVKNVLFSTLYLNGNLHWLDPALAVHFDVVGVNVEDTGGAVDVVDAIDPVVVFVAAGSIVVVVWSEN